MSCSSRSRRPRRRSTKTRRSSAWWGSTSAAGRAAAAGVVVTGGTSIMQGVPELAEGIFDQPVRRGDPIGVGGLADVIQSPIYSTAVGLALYGSQARSESGAAPSATPMGRLTRLVTGFLSDIF